VNGVTYDIASWLDVDLVIASRVQGMMDCNGVDWKNSTSTTLRHEARYAFAMMAEGGAS
jgi:hypothetical protein